MRVKLSYINDATVLFGMVLLSQLHILVKGQVSVSSSAAASMKQGPNGGPVAYISSLSSAKADPKIPAIVNQPMTVNGNAAEAKPKTQWAYKMTPTAYGPANWPKLAPQCAGQNQSPIDIATATAVPKPLGNPLTLSMNEAMGGGEEALVQGKLINNGKAIGFNVNIELTPVKLKGGALEGESYTMRQFHIHYGCAGEKGSEHTLDGVKFEGELHLVFTNDKYQDPKVAMQQKDGLAILAFFFKVRPQADPNAALTRISNNIPNIMNMQQQIAFPDGLSLTNLIPAMKEGLANLKRFVYKGSLPTPPCFESVTWIVFERPIGVQPPRFEKWRQAKGVGGLPLCGNFRPTQPLNGREVFHFTPAAAPPAPTGGPTGGPTPTKKVTTGAPSPTAGATTGAPPTTGAPGTTAPAAPPPI